MDKKHVLCLRPFRQKTLYSSHGNLLQIWLIYQPLPNAFQQIVLGSKLPIFEMLF